MSPFWNLLEYIEANGDWYGGNNWSYKTCHAAVKLSPSTNQHIRRTPSTADLQCSAVIRTDVVLDKTKQVVQRLNQELNSINVRLNGQQDLLLVGISCHLRTNGPSPHYQQSNSQPAIITVPATTTGLPEHRRSTTDHFLNTTNERFGFRFRL